jgi:hypothetical protein
LTVADATDVHTTRTTPSTTRTVVAGLAGGVAFILGNVLTFGLLGGARRGQQGLLFDPDTQSPKVITVWKVLRPLPRIIDTPARFDRRRGGVVRDGLRRLRSRQAGGGQVDALASLVAEGSDGVRTS